MAETITIAGKQLPKTTVYVAGAATLGIVGYAWWTKGTSGVDEEAAPQLPEPVPEPTDDTDFDVTGGGPPPGTNAQWTEKAMTFLSNFGIDAQALSAAIGKFLQRKPLNKVEASLVQQAISAAGYPPENGPWIIIEETTGPVVPPPPVKTKPGAIASIVAKGGKAKWSARWSSASGATSYEIRAIRGYPAGTGLPWRNVGNNLVAGGILRVSYPSTYSFEVRAKNAAGYGPAKRSGPVRVNP